MKKLITTNVFVLFFSVLWIIFYHNYLDLVSSTCRYKFIL